MAETRTIRDPFLNKQVEISSNLLDCLRGKYASGPTLENGEPEFGWRQMPAPPIQIEAAAEIERLRHHCAALQDAINAKTSELYPDLRAENDRLKDIIRRAAPAIDRHWAKTAGSPKKTELLALRREADEVIAAIEQARSRP